jgi:hypothetical protein
VTAARRKLTPVVECLGSKAAPPMVTGRTKRLALNCFLIRRERLFGDLITDSARQQPRLLPVKSHAVVRVAADIQITMQRFQAFNAQLSTIGLSQLNVEKSPANMQSSCRSQCLCAWHRHCSRTDKRPDSSLTGRTCIHSISDWHMFLCFVYRTSQAIPFVLAFC